jgi:anti-sigma B factor antagonist
MFDYPRRSLKSGDPTPSVILSMRANGSFGLHAEAPKAAEFGTTMHTLGNASKGSQPSSIAFAISQRELDGPTRVLVVEGELDLSSAPSLKWALTDIFDAGYSQVVVDLSLVTFIDSTALGVLVGVQRNLNSGARLAIACAHADVLKIFELTGLDGTFDIFSTFDDALAYARGSTAAAG